LVVCSLLFYKAFAPAFVVRRSSSLKGEIAEGVEFDTIAREWRCKWVDDAGKASLVSAQVALESVLGDLKAVDGVKSVERVVCGGCLDFKVIASLDAEKFGAWEEAGFDPEVNFLKMLGDIDGISSIETQSELSVCSLLMPNVYYNF
jgi:hypothetical protein